MKKIDFKLLFKFIVIALIFGIIGAIFGGKMDTFDSLNKPSFVPPAIVFPIVWTILYILMGISGYLICTNNTDEKFRKRAITIYTVQLAVNALWPLFFFRLNMLGFAFVWLLLLLGLVIFMVIKFFKISPVAGYLQIPYILWLIFAGILNYTIYTMN